MRKTKSKWLIIVLLLSIFSLKSQTCNSPILLTNLDGTFTSLTSFSDSTRFLKFTANNFRLTIKLYVQNYNPANMYVRFYNNDCANLATNQLAISPTVNGDSIIVTSSQFTYNNQYLIKIGKFNGTPSLIAYRTSVNGITPQSIGCVSGGPCPSYTCDLVCNGGFEDLDLSLGPINAYSLFGKVKGWDKATGGGTPDIFTSGSTFVGTSMPCNFFGNRAHMTTTCTTNNNYAGIYNVDYVTTSNGRYSEYIETRFKNTLSAGKTYVISFYVSKADNGNASLNKLAIYITPNLISYPSIQTPIPDVPTRVITNPTILNSTSWSKISFCYTANGNENYLTIGMPNDPAAHSVSGNNTLNNSCTGLSYSGNIWGEQHYLYIDEVHALLLEPEAGATQTVSPCGNVQLTGSSQACGLSAGLPLTYQWSGPGLFSTIINPTVNVTSNSTFNFIITATGDDGTQCSTSDNMSVISNTPTPFNLTPSNSSICPGSTVSITASGATSYTFQPGNITTNPAVFSPTTTTTYTVTGYTGSCYMTKTITINTYTNTLSINSTTNNICFGSAITLTASGGNTYTWSPGGQTTSTISVSPGSTTTYTVTGLTNPNNCLKSATKTITVYSLPTITVSPSATNTICLNSSITLTASGASTYTWQAGNIVSPTVILSPTTTTNYTVTGTSSQGCNNTRTVSITVNPLPSISCATNKTLVCQGSTSTLSATGASTYTWSPVGLTGASVVVTSTANPTNYTVTGTSSLGCTNTCVVTQNVFTSGTSFFSVTATPTAICNSPAGTSTLTASGSPNNYTWSPSGQVGSSITSTVAGIFTVTSTNSIGCVGSKTVQLHGTDDVAAFNTIPPVCGTQSINLLNYVNPPMGAGTFSVNGTQISGSIYTFTPSAGIYTVGYTYTAGILCSYTATYALTTNTDCCNSTTLTPITSTLITGTSTITGGKSINQNITIASGANLTFDGGEFIIAPNVQINIQGGGSLFIDGAHLYACQNRMWDGINIQYNGRVISRPGSTGMSTFIEDAKNAINIEPINSPPPTFAAPIEIHNTIFNKNYTAININTVNINMDLDIQLQENVFTCRTITFTPSSWPTTSTVTPGLRSASSGTATTGLTAPYPLQSFSYTTCLSPYSGLPSNAGVRLTNVSYSTSYVYGVQIGESNSIDDQTDFNLFDALAYGIYADESNVSVINNVFQNTRQYNTPPPKPKTKGGSAIYYYVNTDYFRQLNLTNTISSYSLTPSVGNRFWDCHRAVDATNAYILNMEYATVRSTQNTSGGTGFLAGNTGVVSTTNRFSYNFRNNEFTNIRNPINIPIVANTYNYTGTPTVGIYANNFAILNNYFGPVTTTTASTSGQYINNAITISSPNSGNWNKVIFTGLSVMNNQINRVYRGISINGMDSYSTAVSNNTISMVDDGLFNSTQRGIELVNTQNSVVITTNTLSAANTTNTLATLVYLGNNIGTTSPSVTCNNLSSSYQGFEFNNDNRNTFWRGNLMQTHARGMVISNSGTIGVQGSSGAPQDNQWNGTWTGNNHTYVDNTSDAQYSKLWIKSGSPWQPTSNGGLFSQSYNQTGNLNLTTGAFSCGGGGGGGGSGRYSSGAPRVYEVTNNYDQSSYKSGGGTDSIDTNEEYMAVNNSYRILEANPDLISNSSSNAAFYNNYTNTSIGKFAQAEKQAYNGANTQANATSSSVSSKVSVEDNYKTYFALYDKYKSGNLNETDLASLYSLANLCPGIDGPIIYQARALYQVVTKDVIVFKENCEQVSNARQSKKSSITPSVANWDVQLYPNPTSGELNIVSKNNSEQLMVIIKHATGKIVNQNNLQVSDFISNLTLNLENGLYLITITNNKNETTTKKLVIAK